MIAEGKDALSVLFKFHLHGFSLKDGEEITVYLTFKFHLHGFSRK